MLGTDADSNGLAIIAAVNDRLCLCRSQRNINACNRNACLAAVHLDRAVVALIDRHVIFRLGRIGNANGNISVADRIRKGIGACQIRLDFRVGIVDGERPVGAVGARHGTVALIIQVRICRFQPEFIGGICR